MKLIVGLGNPETKYTDTRHNVGYIVLDAFAEHAKVIFSEKTKFKGEIAEIVQNDEKIILVKPTTYYNLSGKAVQALMDFYKIASHDTLIVHDELALDFGTVRTRHGGSDAGNNGIKSISGLVGKQTARLRVGVSNEKRERIDDADFVLSKFTQTESEKMPEIIEKSIDLIEKFIAEKFVPTTV